MPPRPYVLKEANYRQALDNRPQVAILPWGATEAHNMHLPHGTDFIQAESIANEAAGLAFEQGVKAVALPPIPFGNNAQQMDQVATIHIRTDTAKAILKDVVTSLKHQGIDRLVLLNAHGGNDFKPIIRDIQLEHDILIALVNFWQLVPADVTDIFDDPGDHAGELETSLLMHLCPQWVCFDQAGPGDRVPFEIPGISQPGVWSPRPWNLSHPDTGSGDPKASTAEKGERYFKVLTESVAKLLIGLAKAEKGQLPYI